MTMKFRGVQLQNGLKTLTDPALLELALVQYYDVGPDGQPTRAGSDIFGLYSGRFPGEGVPVDDVGAHAHVTRGGSVGIWSKLGQRTTVIGDAGTWIGSWAKQLLITPNLDIVGKYRVPTQNVVGLAEIIAAIMDLAERHPELKIKLGPSYAAMEANEEIAMPPEMGTGEGI